LTKGTRVTVEGVWSKRTRTTKDGQLRINDVLTARKIRLLTETEISATDVDGDDVEYDEATPKPSDLKEPAA
jgi:single-stranded DNA-binding protein